MIPSTAYHLYMALESAALRQETAMPLKPKPKLKGIPVGKFDAIADAAGKMKVKPNKKNQTLQQQYASKNKRRFKAAR